MFNKLYKFALIAAIGLGSSLSVFAGAPFRILVVSDIEDGAKAGQIAVAKQLAKTAELTSPQFIVTCGDNFHGAGVKSASDEKWQRLHEDVYSALALQIPWYATLGNHDYKGVPQAEIDYMRVSEKWNMPARYYSKTFTTADNKTILLVVIDTSPFLEEYRNQDSIYHVKSQNTDIQLKWLDSTLNYTKADFKLVVGHHPIYSGATREGDTKELISNVLPILKKRGVKAYFNGHQHNLQHLVDAKTNFFVCGGGSTTWNYAKHKKMKFAKESLGFALVTIQGSKMQVEFIDDKGETIYKTIIK